MNQRNIRFIREDYLTNKGTIKREENVGVYSKTIALKAEKKVINLGLNNFVTSIFKTQLFANRSKWRTNILQTDIYSPIILEKNKA